MKKWQSYTALKRVKNETEDLTAALAVALENVIVTPAGEEKSLANLAEPVSNFSIIPGILQLLDFPNIGLLATEILNLLRDTLDHSDLDAADLDARLEIAYVATSDVSALLEDALLESGDSFIKVFHLVNRVRKTWDHALVFDSRVLSSRQKNSFKQQYAATPDKMKEVLARQSSLYIKAGKALLDDPGNTRAITALKGVAGNMELMFRDYRLGTLWGLAGGVIDTFQDGAGDSAVKSVIALGKPLHLLSTGDLKQLDELDDNVLGNMLEVISAAKTRSMRLAIIRQWFGLDRKASRQMKTAFRNIQVRYAKKSALHRSLQLINEDINRLVDIINMMIESASVEKEKVEEVYRDAFNLREILMFLDLGFLAEHIDKSLSREPEGDLEHALSQAAGVLFVINKELVDRLENMDHAVFSTEAAIAGPGGLSSAQLHVYLTAMKLLETVITDIDTFVESDCQGSDLDQAREILDELACVFTVVSLPEQKQYLETARDYVNLIARGAGQDMPDATFNALSHLVINSLWYLEQLSIGREQDSQTYLEKSGRFADVLQAFIESNPAPEPDDPGPSEEPTTDPAIEKASPEAMLDAVPVNETFSDEQALAPDRENTESADAHMAGQATEIEPSEEMSGASVDLSLEGLDDPSETAEGGGGKPPGPVEEPHEVPEEEPVPVEEPDEVPADEPPVEDPLPEPDPVEEPSETPEEIPAPQDLAGNDAEESDEDDDIKEIFAEEFDEVMENLREELDNLARDPLQPTVIKDCCRYFHTLKGSGRMVGAEIIGTLSFAMERLYDYTGEQQSTNDEVMALTQRVLDTLPAMKENFMNAAAPAPDPALIQQLCQDAVGLMSPEAAADVEIPELSQPVDTDSPLPADEAEPDHPEIPIITDSVPTLSDSVELSDDVMLADADTNAEVQIDETESIDTVKAEDDTRDVDHELVGREINDINNRISSILGGGEDSPTTSDLQVPLHTLYGIARVQNLESYSGAVSAMESFQEKYPHKTITADMALVFQDFCLLTEKLARHIGKGEKSEYADLAFEAIDLEKSLADLSDSMEQGGGADQGEAAQDDPIITGFLREARDLVAKIEQLASKTATADTLAEMSESLHFLAGAAEMADIESVEKVAASMEAACGQLDPEANNANLENLLVEGRNWLASMPGKLESGEPLDDNGLSERLFDVMSAPTPAPEPVTTDAAASVESADNEDSASSINSTESTANQESEETTSGQAAESTPEETFPVDDVASKPFSRGPEPEELVDQELLAIFLDEADEILEEIDALYLRWQDGDESVIDEFLRHLHTLKGSSALVLEKELSKAAHDYETFLIDARNSGKAPDAEFFATCDKHLQALQDIFRLYNRDETGMIVRQPTPGTSEVATDSGSAEPGTEPEPTEPPPVEEPVATTAPVDPEPIAEPDTAEQATTDMPVEQEESAEQEEPVDQELLAIFLDEADEILEEIDSLYLRWQEGDESVIDEYLRHLHTLKGSSALVREMPLSQGAHEFETFIIDARNAKKGYDAEFFADCDRHMQKLQEIYKLYSRDADGMIVRAGDSPASPAEEPVAETSPVEEDQPAEAPAAVQSPSAATAEAPTAITPRTDEARVIPQQPAQAIQAAAEEQVRVSSQLLKNLMNDADEINFSRNRVEQSFHDISHLLSDMDETLHKVRTYVKRFEDKARESYTTAVQENTELETERISDEFDSLEMDRYTELHEMSLSLTEDYDDLQDIRQNLANRLKDIDNVLTGQQRLTNSLQDGLISSQMVPFSSVVPRLRRLVRQISRELGKDVRFEVENRQGNLDKNVLQAIITPFEHIIRNALDHGIETPEQRAETGKPEQAVLLVRVTRSGASILIEIRDDGRGINVEKVKNRAIERGILEADAEISNDAACQLIFKPGFSTADAVSSISGRGVGLDVVKSEITQIGGTVEISSREGEGTAFVIQLPLTTSLNRSLMFEVQGNRFVVLMNTLDGVKMEKLSTILKLQRESENVQFEYGGKQYDYIYLGKLLNLEIKSRPESVDASMPMLLVSGKDRNFALHIDSITESRDLVVKSLSKQFSTMPGIGGGVITPDGNVAIVLDLVTLVNQLTEEAEPDEMDFQAPEVENKENESRGRLVMVVDDSITVRKVTSSTLKRNGLEVITAKNGLEAIELLETRIPDIILLDIEMPKMDGFETATHIRKQEPPIGNIPIIMITSRIGDKHRTRAQEIGVNEFMSKPFVEQVLLEHIRSYQKK